MIRLINGKQCLIDDETGEVLSEVFFKTPYNHDTNAESDRCGLLCEDESLTDQSFKDDADINNIVSRFLKTGHMPVPIPTTFGDATDRPQSWLEIQQVLAANNATFYKLLPDIRAEFQNNPALWMDQIERDLATGDMDNLDRIGMETKQLREALAKGEADALSKANAKEEAEQALLEKRLAKATSGASPATGSQKPGGGAKTPPNPA